ncbi:MFS transporter [Streptomyces sp. NPDC048441]|uniref:MFS transporter n=1 Tax=Streptomyces sp. NPDC048441 TaxID=3365552 RepID=UPI003724945A
MVKEKTVAAQSAASAPEAAGAEGRNPRRWLILAVICIAQLMVVLDATVMNLAMPSAQEDLGFTDADRQWIVTAYLLAFGSLLLFCGRLVDLIGRKETFLVGLVGFAGASAVGGASNSFGMLAASRACQGVFAALLAPAALALLVTTFTDPKERGKAFGAFSAVAASGGGLGLIIGGSLTSSLSWRWCMYVNLVFVGVAVIGAAALMAGQPKLPSVRARLDVPGIILVSSGMFCLVYGFSNASTHSWGTPSTWGFLIVGAVLLIAFAGWQTRAPHPLLPPHIVLDRNRGGAYLTMLLVGAATYGIFLFVIYYMQNTWGYSAIKSGVALLPMVAATAVSANVGNIKLMPRFGPKPMVTVGLLLGASGMVWLTGIEVESGYASALLGPLMIVGVGMGLIFASALRTGTSGVAPQDAGIASASIQTGQQIGGAIGLALLNTMATSSSTHYVEDHAQGRPTPELFQLATVHGFITAFWWCAGIFAAGAVICGSLMRRGPLRAPTAAAPAGKPTESETART